MSKKEELTVEQKMELAIAKAKEARKRAKDEAKLAMLNNESYVEYLATVSDESDEVKKLTAIMDTLNKMKPIVTNDGSKYGVNIYPVAEYAFGPVMSRVVGIIAGSSAMFTDERQTEFEAITNISYLSAIKARDAIGSPAYYSKGIKADPIPGTMNLVDNAIKAVCMSLDIDLAQCIKVNKTSIDRWFEVEQKKANKKFEEFKKIETVDSENCFVLED